MDDDGGGDDEGEVKPGHDPGAESETGVEMEGESTQDEGRSETGAELEGESTQDEGRSETETGAELEGELTQDEGRSETGAELEWESTQDEGRSETGAELEGESTHDELEGELTKLVGSGMDVKEISTSRTENDKKPKNTDEEVAIWGLLPEDLWHVILSNADECYMDTISLTRKEFNKAQREQKTHLYFCYPCLPDASATMRNIVAGFRNVEYIALTHTHENINDFVDLVAESTLKLKSLYLSKQERFPSKEAIEKLGAAKEKYLQCFGFTKGPLDDHNLSWIAMFLSYIVKLDLSNPHGGNCSDDSIRKLCDVLRNLEYVDFSSHRLPPHLISRLPNLKGFKGIKADPAEILNQVKHKLIHSLSLQRVDGNALKKLRDFPLSVVEFRRPVLIDNDMVDVCNVLSGLTSFTVIHGRLTERTFSHLLEIKGLRNISFDYTYFGLTALQNLGLPNFGLKNLSLRGSISLRDSGLIAVADVCPVLIVLDISGCANITSVGVNYVIKTCLELKSLNLENCINIDNLGPFEVRTCLLEALSSPRVEYGDTWLQGAKAYCRLKYFQLECHHLTMEALFEFVRGNTCIREIHLANTSRLRLSQSLLEEVVEASMPNLKRLVIDFKSIPWYKGPRYFMIKNCLVDAWDNMFDHHYRVDID